MANKPDGTGMRQGDVSPPGSSKEKYNEFHEESLGDEPPSKNSPGRAHSFSDPQLQVGNRMFLSAREKNDMKDIKHFTFDLNDGEDMTSAGTLDRNTTSLTPEEQD